MVIWGLQESKESYHDAGTMGTTLRTIYSLFELGVSQDPGLRAEVQGLLFRVEDG